MRRWTKDETDYLIDNFKTKEYSEISKIINKTPKQIQSKIYLLGLSKRKDEWWTDEQIEFVKSNYDKMAYNEIGKLINKTRSSVQSKIKKLNLHKSLYDNVKKVYNEDYFKIIDNEHKAYWLGFISADGCISDSGGVYKFSIALQRRDENTLKKFLDDINAEFDLQYRDSKLNGKIFKSCYVGFKGKKFVENLLQYIPFRKTNILAMPKNIPQDLIRHYLRGFSDGDGCFYCGKDKNRKSFEIVGNSLEMMNDIKKIFDGLGIKSTIYKHRNNLKIGIYSSESIKKLHSYFYDDATIFMERKFIKCQNILNNMPSH